MLCGTFNFGASTHFDVHCVASTITLLCAHVFLQDSGDSKGSSQQKGRNAPPSDPARLVTTIKVRHAS
jgi:hypothetical protein